MTIQLAVKRTHTPTEAMDMLNIKERSADIGVTMPFIAEKKPGRNDPCPCGSGKKYKNCCGRGS